MGSSSTPFTNLTNTKNAHTSLILGPPLVIWSVFGDKGYIDAVMMIWEGCVKHKSHCLVYVLLSADTFPPFLYSTFLFQLCISVAFSVTTDGLGEATLRTMYFDDGAEAGLLS